MRQLTTSGMGHQQCLHGQMASSVGQHQRLRLGQHPITQLQQRRATAVQPLAAAPPQRGGRGRNGQRRSRAAPSGDAPRRKGFGTALEEPLQQQDVDGSSSRIVDDGGGALDADDGEFAEKNLRSEYQVYADADYKPQRFVAPQLAVQQVPGQRRGLVCTDDMELGQLAVVSAALARVEGEFMAAPPDPEELHVSWLESGVTPAHRRVLDALYDGSEASGARDVSLSTLDPKFWQSRGKHDPQAPEVSSGRLLSILNNGACADTVQDPAVMTLRQQKPRSFTGLWPEYTLLNHSCAPNTAIVVVEDRMLVHVAGRVARGEQLTRNYIPSVASAPAAQRQAALREAGYEWTCGCARCRLEAQAGPAVQEALQAAHAWYTEEALPRFNAANADEDIGVLRELYEEAETLVEEVEQAVQAEEGLTDEERTLLRAAAYDTYDMMLMCDEFLRQERMAPPLLLACLELIQAIAPGSESHAAVALKYDRLVQDRLQMMEAMLKQEQIPRTRGNLSELKLLRQGADASAEYRLTAWVARYGYVSFATLQALCEAYEVYTEGCEQMSIMAAEGKSERVSELDVNGHRVTLVDKMDFGTSSSGSGSSSGGVARRTERSGNATVSEIRTREGLRVLVSEEAAPPPQAAAEDGEVVEVGDGEGGLQGEGEPVLEVEALEEEELEKLLGGGGAEAAAGAVGAALSGGGGERAKGGGAGGRKVRVKRRQR